MITFDKIKLDDLIFLNETRNQCAEEFLHDSRKFTIDETLDWFEKTNPDYYIIFHEKNKIGYFRLSNYSKLNKNLYLGADIHENYRGKGYAFESYSKFIPYIFEKYNLNKISLEVLKTNIRAIRLYEKLGFIKEGIKREEVLKKEGFVDSIIMSILKKEFKKKL